MMQRNAGTDSEKSLKSIFTTEAIIINPTSTRTGAVAEAGMARKNGAKKIASKKQMPETNA